MKDRKKAFMTEISPARIPDFLGAGEPIGLRSTGAQPSFKVARDVMEGFSVGTAFSALNWPISNFVPAQPLAQ
jgi:hypothetical protein